MYVWTGSGFQGLTFVATQFFTDPNNNLYLYEQNYNGFFPFTLSNNVITYSGNGMAVTVANNTVFTVDPSLANQVSNGCAQVFNIRFQAFTNQSKNILHIYTQTPSSYVVNTITQGVSANSTNVTAALQTYAPFLVSTQDRKSVV